MKTNKTNLLVLAIVLFISVPQMLHAQDSMEVTSKKFIAYSLYNFSKLIVWPNSSSAATFGITVVGDKTVYEELLNLAKNRKVCNATYDIKFSKKTEEISGMNQIIYLSNMFSGKVKQLDKDPNLKNVLLVTEREGMTNFGSVISFTVTEQGTLGFEIAKTNASKKQLSIGAQLERMAVNVK